MRHTICMTLMFVMLIFLFEAAITSNARTMESAAKKLKVLADKYNVTSIVVFGDSSVDPGNNNNLPDTWHKGNFLPYGNDFGHSIPTGRFTNGKLVTDYIAGALGYTTEIKAYLDSNLMEEDLLHGVSFASGGSECYTVSLNKQLEYFKEYKNRLEKLVGKEHAHNIVENAVFVLSMGTNDFLQNYYIDPTRPGMFTITQYQQLGFTISTTTPYPLLSPLVLNLIRAVLKNFRHHQPQMTLNIFSTTINNLRLPDKTYFSWYSNNF
ncbi:SGNH hydrolase-type esterase domain-containing protein [Artemisia annua]|uniref:SGNH hydrolase-type esterase domain-containing protein n=1 Tax=Artemisia annua TaxID=35608 RepID=A0A2U1MXP2_ARTAN|nr:SGNH hydrolase-type esterase domain-containing protein [Artemisia annua]